MLLVDYGLYQRKTFISLMNHSCSFVQYSYIIRTLLIQMNFNIVGFGFFQLLFAETSYLCYLQIA